MDRESRQIKELERILIEKAVDLCGNRSREVSRLRLANAFQASRRAKHAASPSAMAKGSLTNLLSVRLGISEEPARLGDAPVSEPTYLTVNRVRKW